MDKKKTPTQMQAELRLADFESNKSDFLTTSRVGVHRLKKKTTEERFVKIKFVFMIFGQCCISFQLCVRICFQDFCPIKFYDIRNNAQFFN